ERPVVPRTSGLYHLALLVPDRRELARVIGRLARLRWEQYPTDHVMTKANYLWDPDGNGIEIYIESPEDGTMGFANGTFVAYDKDGRDVQGATRWTWRSCSATSSPTTASTCRCRAARRWAMSTYTWRTSTMRCASTTTWSAST